MGRPGWESGYLFGRQSSSFDKVPRIILTKLESRWHYRFIRSVELLCIRGLARLGMMDSLNEPDARTVADRNLEASILT